MSFHEVQFPIDISYGSGGGPEFKTTIIEMSGGKEQRNVDWSQSRAKYNVAWGVRNQTQLEALIAFFYARQGRAFGFRYKDWADYGGAAQVIGTGNASLKIFQLVKNYISGGVTYVRTILKPVTGTTKIFLGGAEATSGWSLDTTTGLVTFINAPGSGVIVTATYSFDVPVRFDMDALSTSFDDYGSNSANDVRLIELK